jgi:2-keto-4-pentenoate hydratase
MDKEQRRDAARDLLRAYETRRGIEPLTSTYTDMVLDDAYAVQLAQVQEWTGRGRRIKGHKVGLTSAAMQRMLGVDQPDFGHLTDDMFWTEFQPIPTSRFLQPRVEPEIAFVLGRDLSGPGVNAAEAIRAIDFVLPALELIDSRIRDWKIKLFDTIADNASSGGVVLGSRATAPDRVDLRLVGCNLYRNGAFVDSGANGAVLGSPITALVWLANTLGVRGVTLEAGHVVLPGSCTAAMPVAPGDTVLANFAGLGGVTAVFARNGGS